MTTTGVVVTGTADGTTMSFSAPHGLSIATGTKLIATISPTSQLASADTHGVERAAWVDNDDTDIFVNLRFPISSADGTTPVSWNVVIVN